MVGEELVNASSEVILELGRIGNWLQAVGLLVVLWIAFNVYSTWMNRKRWDKLKEFEVKVDRIEGKIDKLTGKKK
jgi:hypothetical protein